jgi:hypothetical protein
MRINSFVVVSVLAVSGCRLGIEAPETPSLLTDKPVYELFSTTPGYNYRTTVNLTYTNHRSTPVYLAGECGGNTSATWSMIRVDGTTEPIAYHGVACALPGGVVPLSPIEVLPGATYQRSIGFWTNGPNSHPYQPISRYTGAFQIEFQVLSERIAGWDVRDKLLPVGERLSNAFEIVVP